MGKKKRIVNVDADEGQRAGEAVIEAVENQILNNSPPEVRETLERLMAMGEPRENAMRYIGAVLLDEMFQMINSDIEHDPQRYINKLKALPKLPFDE